MKIDYIEFDDPDDPRSNVHPSSGIRFVLAPESLFIALPNGSALTSEDKAKLGLLLRLAYEQGKSVGRKLIQDGTGQPE